MKRNNSLDLLRILSTIAVIAIHSNAHYLFSDTIEEGSVYYLVGTIINTFMRFSVPAFVMISGAFNISEKNSDFRYFYTKSLKKVFLPMLPIILILYSVIAGAYMIIKHEYAKPLLNYITGGIFAYWFMYMLFFLYLLTPFIVIIKHYVSNKAFEWASLFMLFWACFSQALSTQKAGNTMGTVFAFVGYYMIGNVIYERSKDQRTNKKTIHLLISVVLLSIASVVRYLGFSYYNYNPYVSFFSPLVILASVSLFKWFCSIHIETDYIWLSSKTFYIYLFHDIVLEVLFLLLDKYSSLSLVNVSIATILVFLVSLICAVLYSKIWSFAYAKFSKS